MVLPVLAYDKDYEPDGLDGFTLAPFILSQTFTEKAALKLSESRWHGFWVVPISIAVNICSLALLLVTVTINTLAAVIALMTSHGKPWGRHHINTSHDALIYSGLSFARIFWAPFNPLKVPPAEEK